MRRTLALVLTLVFGSGCFVIDEIDAGMKIMEEHTPTSQKKQDEAKTRDGAKPSTYQKTVQAWWKDAKTLSTSSADRKASDDPILPCTHRGKTVFTKKSDCIARGGQPG